MTDTIKTRAYLHENKILKVLIRQPKGHSNCKLTVWKVTDCCRSCCLLACRNWEFFRDEEDFLLWL